MNRKDVIIVACLLNLALFMILFATASVWDGATEETKGAEKLAQDVTVQENSVYTSNMVLPRYEESVEVQEIVPLEQEIALLQRQQPIDEIDEVVQEYTKKRDVLVQQPPKAVQKEAVSEVVVKKGDVLSKIAKAQGVSVDEIMRLNNLSSTKLKIGQVLKIKKKTTEPPVVSDTDKSAYYIVQGGDNPWKIARKCKIDYDELLRLNNLNEEKAKNLKIGQKLRIK